MTAGSTADRAGGLSIAVGARLKEIRQGKRLTLREVAKQLGLSASLLSQVENGKTQPSVGTLYGLVTFYQVSMDAVMTGRESAPPAAPSAADTPRARMPEFNHGAPVQRAHDNPTLVMENGVTWQRLAVATNDHAVQPLLVTYAPGASSSLQGKWTQHLGIEYAYLLSGVLALHLEFDVHEVRPGDSIAFDSTRPHFYSNETDQDAQAVFFVDNRAYGAPGGDAAGTEGMAGILAQLRFGADLQAGSPPN